jgi:hypothetical protein
VALPWVAAQHRLQATRLRRLLVEGKRAQTGLLLKVLRRTRRAPEPYRWAAVARQTGVHKWERSDAKIVAIILRK